MSAGAGAIYDTDSADWEDIPAPIEPDFVLEDIKAAYAQGILSQGKDLNTAMASKLGFAPGEYYHAGAS
jgi:hypothetical protein